MNSSVQVGDRFPVTTLPSPSGHPIQLVGVPRRSLAVLVLPRDPAPFESYRRQFQERLETMREWCGRPVVVRAECTPAINPGQHAAETVDATGELRERLGLAPTEAAVVVADRWGEIYSIQSATRADDLPGMEETEEWLKYLATQCPECGVPDAPGYGEWTYR